MKPSIITTLRLLFHPLDAHGFTHVSGSSREVSGPDWRSRRMMSFRQASLALTQAALAFW